MMKIYENPICFLCRWNPGALSVLKSEKGQTLIEYSLLLVLIAVVVVMMVKGVGITANNTYSQVNSAVTSAMN
jgi:Flp pilus assembly pilin Flp